MNKRKYFLDSEEAGIKFLTDGFPPLLIAREQGEKIKGLEEKLRKAEKDLKRAEKVITVRNNIISKYQHDVIGYLQMIDVLTCFIILGLKEQDEVRVSRAAVKELLGQYTVIGGVDGDEYVYKIAEIAKILEDDEKEDGN